MSQAHNRVGVMLNNLERDRLRAFAVARALGFTLVHANALPEAMLDGPGRTAYIHAARESGLTIPTIFVGFDGQDYSSLRSIAATVGLVQPELRPHRLAVARRYSDLAAELRVPSLSMHLGLLPQDGDHGAIVDCLRELLEMCAAHGQTLHLETGQESAADLLQLIQNINRPNLFVNFDPANFVIYGTDEPIAALDMLYPLVRGVHCKDGVPSAMPGELGRETPLSQGAVNFPAFLRRLLTLGYTGPLVIEREHGPNVVDEILAARSYVGRLMADDVCV
jgi:sugar phosphate isomerase/epimerase